MLTLFFRRFQDRFHWVQQRRLVLPEQEQVKQVMGLLKNNLKG